MHNRAELIEKANKLLADAHQLQQEFTDAGGHPRTAAMLASEVEKGTALIKVAALEDTNSTD